MKSIIKKFKCKKCEEEKRCSDINYYDKFLAIHELLKKYDCRATFDFKEEYQSPTLLGGYNFYKPEADMHNDKHKKEWDEKVDARLDVVVSTKWKEAPKGVIRFDIDYSDRVKLYSMYISLPTSGRSKSLSRRNFKTQDEISLEINKWLAVAGCKKKKRKQKDKSNDLEQLSMFQEG